MAGGECQPVAATAEVGTAGGQRQDGGSVHPVRGRDSHNRHRLRAIWTQTVGPSLWCSLIYGVLSLPAGIGSLLLALSGAHRAAARLQRGLAIRWLHFRLLPREGEYRRGQTIVHALLTSMIGVLCWLLAALAGPNTVRCVLLYPITDGGDLADSWGGPTLAGAWAVHAALALLLLPVLLWLLLMLTALQRRLAARLLGTDQAPWVLPVAVLVAGVGLALLWAFANQL